MGSVCTDHHHHHNNKLHHHQYLFSSPKKSHHSHLQDLNIPPRKLLSRRSPPQSPSTPTVSDLFSDNFPLSPSNSKHSSDSLLMRKFLPFNRTSTDLPTAMEDSATDNGYDPDSDPYSSDDFRMYEFKVRRCTRSRSHDWTDCPFAHPGEKARRRDPRRHHYSSEVCPEYRRSGGHCSRGDDCEFAHGVFEVWLHPARYRTEACKDGKGCKRKVCFFAHSPRELRVLPAAAASIRDGDGQVNGGGDETQLIMGGGDLVSLGDLLMKSGGGGSGSCCRYNYSPRSTLQQVGSGGSYCMNCCGGGMGMGMGMGIGMGLGGNQVNSSPPMSPPSPTTNVNSGRLGCTSRVGSSFSPLRAGTVDRFACMDQMMGEEDYLSNKDIALGHLMNSLEAMSFNNELSSVEESLIRRGNGGMNIVNDQGNSKGSNGLWVDVYCPSPSSPEEYGDDSSRFLGSSLSSSPYGIRNLFSPAAGGGDGESSYGVFDSFPNPSYPAMEMMMSGAEHGSKVASSSRFSKDVVSGGGMGDPDLGWVDDLLM